MSDSILSRSWCKAVGKSSIVVFVRVFWRIGDRIRVDIVAVRTSVSGREFTVLIWKFGALGGGDSRIVELELDLERHVVADRRLPLPSFPVAREDPRRRRTTWTVVALHQHVVEAPVERHEH